MVNWTYCERLIANSSLDTELIRDRLIYIETNWNEFTEVEYYDTLEVLRNSQIDPILSGLNYNQTDIVKHLQKTREL